MVTIITFPVFDLFMISSPLDNISFQPIEIHGPDLFILPLTHGKLHNTEIMSP